MSNITRPTRWYSSRQERAIAKATGGKQNANSGATRYSKGDVRVDGGGGWLIEAKTATTEKKSFSIKREWLDKNKEEAFSMNKRHNALCFDFGDNGDRFYIISEKEFKNYMELLESLDG